MLAAKRGQPVSARHCACGYGAADDSDLLDHLLEVFTPDDDRAPDSVLHAEAASAESGRKCLCGYTASDSRGLDPHLLAAFTPPDGIAVDGRQHVAMP
jgi:hypothetical protein